MYERQDWILTSLLSDELLESEDWLSDSLLESFKRKRKKGEMCSEFSICGCWFVYSQFQEKRARRKAPAGTTSSCSLESISQICRRSEQQKQLKKSQTLSSCMQAGSQPLDETPLASKHLLALPLQRCSAFMWGRMEATRVEAIGQVSPHPLNNPDRLEAFAESRLMTRAKNSTGLSSVEPCKTRNRCTSGGSCVWAFRVVKSQSKSIPHPGNKGH